MYERRSRRCCAAMLVVSVCLRVCMALGLDAAAVAAVSRMAQSREFARFMLYLGTGAVARAEQPAELPHLWVLRMEQPQPTVEPVAAPQAEPPKETSPEPLALPLASAEQLSIGGGCSYAVDKRQLLERVSALSFSGDEPQILIIHTHGSEAYTPTDAEPYTESGSYRTLDAAQSVIRVGEVLAETLQERGIAVLHDRSLNDYPSYNDSYATALTKLQQWKTLYPNLQMVIDVHRDAVEDAAGQAVALSATQQGESCARLMLVVGTDQGGLNHPYWQENLANALKLQAVLEGQYPGLCRDLDLRTERFNQHVTPGSLLVEVGSNGNTLEQAERSARLLGDGLADMITALETNNGLLLPQG